MIWRLKMWVLQKREKVVRWVVWRLPRKLVYWCSMRMIAETSCTKAMAGTDVGAMRALDLIKVWEQVPDPTVVKV